MRPPESAPSAQAQAGLPHFPRRPQRLPKERKRKPQLHAHHKAAKRRGCPPLSVCPPSPHLYVDHRTQLPDPRCKAGQTEQAQLKAAVSCFSKISGLSAPLAFQSGDLHTATSEFGLVERRVEDRAILTDVQAQARPASLPVGRRLPGVGAVEQLQVLGEAQLHLPKELHLLALKGGAKTLQDAGRSITAAQRRQKRGLRNWDPGSRSRTPAPALNWGQGPEGWLWPSPALPLSQPGRGQGGDPTFSLEMHTWRHPHTPRLHHHR